MLGSLLAGTWWLTCWLWVGVGVVPEILVEGVEQEPWFTTAGTNFSLEKHIHLLWVVVVLDQPIQEQEPMEWTVALLKVLTIVLLQKEGV